MQLLVGLGNPGARYERTRHNAGFMALDAIGSRYGISAPKQKFRGILQEAKAGMVECRLFQPQTFMNLSGEAVGELLRFYKLSAEAVTVFHDDLDLQTAKIRIKRGGGHGGHNGLKSLDAHIGSNYRRVRIGIGHPGDKDMVSDYVLHDFSQEESRTIAALCDAMAASLPWLLAENDAEFMNKVAPAGKKSDS